MGSGEQRQRGGFFLVSKERRWGGFFCLISIDQWHPVEGEEEPRRRDESQQQQQQAAAGETGWKGEVKSSQKAREPESRARSRPSFEVARKRPRDPPLLRVAREPDSGIPFLHASLVAWHGPLRMLEIDLIFQPLSPSLGLRSYGRKVTLRKR
ncbi:hypothetical protein K440DRAFT_637515 [Wilcoxina mikolae CBS 423.85]|nr:hypothetical protein K440DRAFT_637515 [Wilcoxina mikolae CBS 423.85]